MPVVSIDNVTVTEDQGSAFISVELDVVDTVDTVISIATVANTATDPDDYTTTIFTATIPAGQLGVSFSVPITDDSIGEPTENFFVNGTVTSGNTTNTNPSGIVTIGANDTPFFNVQDQTVQELDGAASIQISLSNPSSQDTFFDIMTINNTAVSPVDYTAVNDTGIVLSAGLTSFSYSIPIVSDTAVEVTEDFSVNVTATSGNTANTYESGTITIIDDDTSTFFVNDVTIAEDDGSAIVTVGVSNPNPVETTIQINTVDNSAVHPNDYTSLSITTTLAPFQTTTTFSIPITDDNIGEATEDFSVNATVTSGNTSNSSDSATITIIDNDDVELIIDDITVLENDGTIMIPITISAQSVVDTTINITTTNDTATDSDDYTSVMTTVTIPALQSTTNITISLTDDDVFEAPETFTVQGIVISGNTINSSDTATITINDDGSCGSGTVGAPCDDGNPATLSDFIDENCNCVGEAVEDIDGDGISNGQETLLGTDYNNPCDPVQNIGYTGYDADNSVWQTANCDNDDINNALEVVLGSDPYDTNYNTIAGNISYDVNADGCNGVDDVVFPFTSVIIDDGSNTRTRFTDTAGDYSYITTTGNFTITPNLENPTFFTITPANATTNFSTINNSVFTQDFCITNSGTNPDIEIVIAPVDFARPGFDAVYLITYKNKGNEIVSGDISFTYDDTITSFVSATEMPSSQTAGVVNWNYTNLVPFESRNFYVVLNVNPPTATQPVNIGDQLVFTATINPITGDIFPNDNQFTYTQTVVGSYDPNDITCVEGNFVDPNEIGEYLHYIINFENTGNFFAQNIVVEMQVDPTQFNIATMRMLSSSHDANVSITGNEVRFIFQDILLDAGGQGNILLKMRSQNTLVEDDVVSNEANIFFDYNFPIQTNTETTAFTLSTEAVRFQAAIQIYPNPTKDAVYISANKQIKSIELYDIQGRILTQENYNSNTIHFNMSTETVGVYFLKIKTEKGVQTQKIIKM
ncbi:DUF7619 domain-containing protein [Kordia jejudonensis]|uniref:DUF7619 domain-containing protein n=1 Tax=Kordia jejudonensis TaxID=1348245 RepID=UPI00138E4678|nr:Calx-beta domain-containing protein [Kordia jejudonensis]